MSRWRPSRAGILNVWRYYDETFTFHEGRLLLRGPNGAGKSKALELLGTCLDAHVPDTMHWNLMGDGGDSIRVGYVWLEFQRDDEWFTCGVRLQASMSTTDVQASYFTTSQRIGDLLLVNDVGRPITRVNLARAIGSQGKVHGEPADYLAEIHATLGTLAANEEPTKALARLAPPPVVSESENFERQRDKLEQLDDAITTVETLIERQDDYTRQVIKDAAAKLRAATERLSTLDAEDTRGEEEKQKLAEAVHQEQLLSQELGEIDARLSGALRQEEIRHRLAEAHTKAEQATKHAQALKASADEDAEDAATAKEAAQKAVAAAEAAKTLAQERADQAGMSLDDRQQVDARTRQIDRTRRALVQRDYAEWTQKRLERVEKEEIKAAQALDEARDKLNEDRNAWALRCRELVIVELTEAEINEAVCRKREEISRTELRLEENSRAIKEQLAQYTFLRDKLANQVDVPPPAPYTRESDRTMEGAPLWRLVEFRPHMPPNLCTAIEAALEASGLLDAWITPHATTDHDTFADENTATPAPGASLLDVLVPNGHAVHRILEGIAFGETAPEHPAAVGADGSWRLGSLRGRWAKAEPTYIGVDAREKAAQQRVAELTVLIDKLQTDLEECDEAAQQVAAQREALAKELTELPSSSAVDEASALHTAARARCDLLRDTVAKTQQVLAKTLAIEGELPSSEQELDDAMDAIVAFRDAADSWTNHQRQAEVAEKAAATRQSRAETSRAHAEEAEQLAALLAQEEQKLVAALDSDDDGLDELRTRRQQIEAELAELRKQRSTLERLVGSLETDHETQREQAIAARDAAAERFQRLHDGQEVTPGPHDLDKAELRLTRAVEDARLLLSSRVELSLARNQDVIALTVTLDRKPATATALLEWLREQRDRLADQLAADEQRGKTLSPEVSERLALWTRTTEQLMASLNARIEHLGVRFALQGHEFVVQVKRKDGWQPLTNRTALSAGERAMIQHVTRTAVVAAHYETNPTAPRLIVLDDVFAGMDSANRGRLLDLLVAFDLDVVLTSDDEWCDYAELPGIAIHQLVAVDAAVTSVRFTWTGSASG